MWDLGDTVPLGFSVSDDQGELVDPASVALVVTLPDGTVLDPPPAVTSPSTGRYVADYVPTVAGLHLVRWVAHDPMAAFADVVDVRDDAFLVSLADARSHLNQTSGRTADDEELRSMLLAAGERVQRHLGVVLAGALTASQRLAVLEVLCELWDRSQRARYGGARAGGYGGNRVDPEDGLGRLPLERRLTDLLGEPALPAKGAPRGSFPPPLSWPC